MPITNSAARWVARSPVFGKHFFTADKDEADHIRAVDTSWNYEGIAYYVLP